MSLFNSIEVAFSALTLLVVRQEEHKACKIEVLVWLSVDCLHMVQLMPLNPKTPHNLLPQLNPDWFTFLVPAYPGCPGKAAIKQV